MSWSVLRVIVLVELCTFIDDRILSVYRPDTGMFYTTCICTYTCICLKLMGATFLCINILIRIIPPPTQIRLQQYWYQSKKARVQKYLLTLIFSPFQSRIKRLCISSEGYPKIEYAYMYVQSEMGRWAVIYRNLNTLEQGSKNRMILNRKPASSFVIFINILGWTLKFYTFHLINKTQNILEGLYIVNVSL